jgi:hypothetical protein
VEALTALVVIGKVAEVAPACTVTLAATWAVAVSLLDNVTTAPPAGAAPLKVTVPVDPLPPATVAGFTVTEDNVTAGVTVRVALCVPPYVPVMVTGVEVVTVLVVTGNVAVVAPAATVTFEPT